jgi:hypothetical protein
MSFYFNLYSVVLHVLNSHVELKDKNEFAIPL